MQWSDGQLRTETDEDSQRIQKPLKQKLTDDDPMLILSMGLSSGMAHSDCRWTCGCAGKTVKSLENTCHTWALLWWSFTTKRCDIKCMHLYLFSSTFRCCVESSAFMVVHQSTRMLAGCCVGEAELEGLTESDQSGTGHDVARASPLPPRLGAALNPGSQGQLSRTDAYSCSYSLGPPTKGLHVLLIDST